MLFLILQDFAEQLASSLGIDLEKLALNFDANKGEVTYHVELTQDVMPTEKLELQIDLPDGSASFDFSTDGTTTGAVTLQFDIGIDIDIEPGTTYGLVGESGCGKSTLDKVGALATILDNSVMVCELVSKHNEENIRPIYSIVLVMRSSRYISSILISYFGKTR